jgi:hypothetical protein
MKVKKVYGMESFCRKIDNFKQFLLTKIYGDEDHKKVEFTLIYSETMITSTTIHR